MNRPASVFCYSILCSAAFLSACERGFAGDSPNIPTVFKTSFGGMMGTYSVEWRDGALMYVSTKFSKTNETARVVPTDAQWKEFCTQLDGVNAWRWRSKYVNNDVTDGFFWSVEIQFPNRSVKAFVVNSYPKADGTPSEEYTDTFKKYLKALGKLLGGKNFD
jgi:hypothetical protein